MQKSITLQVYYIVIEDEYHFLVSPSYRDLGQIFFKTYYFSWSCVHKFNILMQTKSTTTLKKVAQYFIEACEKKNVHV